MYDIVIVGAGPAGLTAAIYARRAAKSVLVLEAKAWGGQIINTPDIENYPVVAHVSGADFANRLYEQALGLGAEVKLEKVIGLEDRGTVKLVRSTAAEYEAGAVILATGSENRKLGVDREQELTGKGVSYCATCDGNFFRRRDVAVVGGGNTALEDALYLSELANKVYLIHRRDSFRGEEASAARLKEKQNVELVLNSTVTALLGDKRLTGVEVTDKLSGEKRVLEVKGLFVAVGRIPENENFRALVQLDGSGYAVAGEDCHTRTPGVFVAGDNRTKELRQLVTAAADGAMAATEAVKYLNA
ncbi:MAG: FAD-dependent oxidoreductase [Oscillospiraceae bacterium]|nr:FAD-dependent oxidoreductase [Oscillospiraceae bacterium]